MMSDDEFFSWDEIDKDDDYQDLLIEDFHAQCGYDHLDDEIIWEALDACEGCYSDAKQYLDDGVGASSSF